MEWNRWDIVEAHYWFNAHYHTGQWSDEYRRLCRISRYYRPSPLASGPTTDNAWEIYNALVERTAQRWNGTA